jgi:hypothetical protein
MAAKLFEDSPQVQTPVGFSLGSLYLRFKKFLKKVFRFWLEVKRINAVELHKDSIRSTSVMR